MTPNSDFVVSRSDDQFYKVSDISSRQIVCSSDEAYSTDVRSVECHGRVEELKLMFSNTQHHHDRLMEHKSRNVKSYKTLNISSSRINLRRVTLPVRSIYSSFILLDLYSK